MLNFLFREYWYFPYSIQILISVKFVRMRLTFEEDDVGIT